MRAHLLSHEAEIEEDFVQFCASLSRTKVQRGYLLVPHTTLQSDVPKASQGSDYLKIVTDMWLERCIHRGECVDPQAHPASMPFLRLYPIPGMSAIFLAKLGMTNAGRVREHHNLLHCIWRCRPFTFDQGC